MWEQQNQNMETQTKKSQKKNILPPYFSQKKKIEALSTSRTSGKCSFGNASREKAQRLTMWPGPLSYLIVEIWLKCFKLVVFTVNDDCWICCFLFLGDDIFQYQFRLHESSNLEVGSRCAGSSVTSQYHHWPEELPGQKITYHHMSSHVTIFYFTYSYWCWSRSIKSCLICVCQSQPRSTKLITQLSIACS